MQYKVKLTSQVEVTGQEYGLKLNHQIWLVGDVAIMNNGVQAVLCLCEASFSEGTPHIKTESTDQKKRRLQISPPSGHSA